MKNYIYIYLNNGWLIIQLYNDKIIQDEFWNGIQVFIPTNGNTNQNSLSLLVPSNQFPLLPLPSTSQTCPLHVSTYLQHFNDVFKVKC